VIELHTAEIKEFPTLAYARRFEELPPRVRGIATKWMERGAEAGMSMRKFELMCTDYRRRHVILIRWLIWLDLYTGPAPNGHRPSLPVIARYWHANHTSVLHGIQELNTYLETGVSRDAELLRRLGF
jgi:hypothetical protein